MFAKNVPKPKVSVKKSEQNSNAGERNDRGDLGNVYTVNELSNEHLYDTMGGTGTGDQDNGDQNELNELAEKHDAYADELEKIKQMLM